MIHQLTLPDGLENSTVIDAFEMATKSGLYDNTLRRDWAGLDCEEDMGESRHDASTVHCAFPVSISHTQMQCVSSRQPTAW